MKTKASPLIRKFHNHPTGRKALRIIRGMKPQGEVLRVKIDQEFYLIGDPKMVQEIPASKVTLPSPSIGERLLYPEYCKHLRSIDELLEERKREERRTHYASLGIDENIERLQRDEV